MTANDPALVGDRCKGLQHYEWMPLDFPPGKPMLKRFGGFIPPVLETNNPFTGATYGSRLRQRQQ